MPSQRIHKKNKQLPHFITLTVVNWLPLFNRHNRWEILNEALSYRIAHQALKVYAYVFMVNHIHMMVSSPDLIRFIRDYKKFTTYKMKLNITEFEPELLRKFINSNGNFQLWQSTNMPIVLGSANIVRQKMKYIYENPVRKKYVQMAEDWKWSSFCPDNLVKIEPV